MAAKPIRSKKSRRITDIEVDEISAVDKPANGEPFLLYKRADDGPAPTRPDLSDWPELRKGLAAISGAPVDAPGQPPARPVKYDSEAVTRMLRSLA